jgi:hypothetical protein
MYQRGNANPNNLVSKEFKSNISLQGVLRSNIASPSSSSMCDLKSDAGILDLKKKAKFYSGKSKAKDSQARIFSEETAKRHKKFEQDSDEDDNKKKKKKKRERFNEDVTSVMSKSSSMK